MAALKPFLYAQFLFLISSCLSSKRDVALNFNTASKEYQMKMSQGKNTFLELISKGLFVDKTLLIDAFINHHSESVIISRPHGWGKTVHLDMLRMFFEMPLHPNGTRILPISSTPNYRLFKEGEYYSNGYNITLESPLLISQPEYSHLIEEHLGQYPVIYWSFNDIPFINNSNEAAILAEINKKVYDQHRYLPAKYDWRNEINYYVIPNFINRLNDYFKKKTVVLVDGYYDRFPKEREDIESLLRKLQSNKEQKVLLTGTEKGNMLLLIYPNLLKHISPFQNLYGFTNTEMSLIYNHYSIAKQEQNLIQYWYGGYKLSSCWYRAYFKACTPDEMKREVFDPSAICGYLNTRQFESFSLHEIYNSYMKKLMKFPTSLYIFTRSINGGVAFICLCLYRRPFSCHTPSEYDSLINGGYLLGDEEIPSAIPNFQTANHLQNTLAPYCTGLFDCTWSTLLTETCSIWDWFLLSDEATSYKLQSNMNKCYKLMSTYYEEIIYYNGGEVISNSVKAQLSAVTSIMPSKKLHFVGWHYECFPKNQSDNLLDTKIQLSSGARGIFISIRAEEDETDSVVNRSSRYTQILKQYAEFHRWKDIKFVDCKLLPHNKLEIHATVRPLNET